MPREDHKLQRAELSTGLRTALYGTEMLFRDAQTVAIFGSPLQCSAMAMLVLREQMHLRSSQPWREVRREELGFHPEHKEEQMGKLNSKQLCCLAASGWAAAPAEL